jgi:hypothetical protein
VDGVNIVRAVMLTICAAVVGLSVTAPARACVYAPGFDQDREISDNMARVTAIYEGVVEDVTQGSWHGEWNFTLRSTRSVWGSNPPVTQQLTRENGACSNWSFLTDQDEDAPISGTKVIVFATPEGEANNLWLYIVRADSPASDILFERFGSTPAGRQFQAAQ